MKNILFVCTGNTCRSPMAEELFRLRAGKNNLWNVSSAGIFPLTGSSASEGARRAIGEMGASLETHRSRQFDREIAEQADLIIVMTAEHRRHIRKLYPDIDHRVHLINEFGNSRVSSDLRDPYGGTLDFYKRTRDEVDQAIAGLIVFLRAEDNMNKEKRRSMKISISADHGGFALKTYLVERLEKQGVEVEDHGCYGPDAVDYPDFAAAVAADVSQGCTDQGVIICTSGIGVSITANKFPGVRAALCIDAAAATVARSHNNANVLCLSGKLTAEKEADEVLNAWLSTKFEGGRHARRVNKIEAVAAEVAGTSAIREADPEIHTLLLQEGQRQKESLELIASENITSKAVREAQGSCMTNKYAEGYPGRRWYSGCKWVDGAERLAIDRAKKLFGAEHANVQPHSGSSANMAVYFSQLNPGDTILAMSLAEGGHLTHGHPMNFSGRFFSVVSYGVDRETERIDYDNVQRIAAGCRPKIIVAGASAYSRTIDFKRIRQIADSVEALLLVDMAHISGLIAAGCHPSPVPVADFVTTTTHKTLRGPRGGLILCKEQFGADIDKHIFPGTQGGPLMHTIAAKAVCFHEALQPSFKPYMMQVVKNAQAMAAAMADESLRMVSGGTDNHLMLVDLSKTGITGKAAANALDLAAITVNKNQVPFDTKSPSVTSGIRIGTPAVTTRGMTEAEMEQIAGLIKRVIHAVEDDAVIAAVRKEVLALTATFPSR